MYKNKRGMSAIVTMLIIIALALVAIGAVWVIVNNLISDTGEEVTRGADDIFADCVGEGGSLTTEAGVCEIGEEKRTIGGEYCCI